MELQIAMDEFPIPLTKIVLYSKNVEETVDFYSRHFGFRPEREHGDHIVELVGPHRGASLLIHPAGKGIKLGQSTVKLVFDVADVPAFCAKGETDGLIFGPMHTADGYVYANARDPSGNPISISSRAFRNP